MRPGSIGLGLATSLVVALVDVTSIGAQAPFGLVKKVL